MVLMLVGGPLSSCRGQADDQADVYAPGAPATMMAALHTMAEHSQALPPPGNLDLYFAQLMRENHRAALAMVALELQHGLDPQLRPIAKEMHQVHQHLILGLDSSIARLRGLPPCFPEHTPQSHELAELLEAATKGLHPAAHRSIARTEPGADTLAPVSRQQDAGTGNNDRDFAALLAPHHQKSMTLARAELELGRDESLRKVAYYILLD